MANAVGGSVVWDLDVDDKKLKEGLNRAKNSVNDAANSIDKSSVGISSSISNAFEKARGASFAFAGGLALIGTSLVGAATFAVKSAGDMEMLRSSLDTLTGSTENGAKIFKDLYKFAASTPFETGDLAKATNTMLGFGISSKDVMKNLGMLGDISMGNSDKLQSLSLSFSQMTSTGHLMGQDLLQMINAGFNPLGIIAKKTGKSISELKDEMAAGAITSQMVTDAMVTATSKGGLFFEGMKKGAATLPGIMSTLQDTIGMTMRKIVGLSELGEVVKGGLVDKVKTAVTDLTNFLSANQDKILAFFQNGLGWMKDNGPIIAGIILGALTPAFASLAVSIGSAALALLPFILIGAAVGLIAKLLIDNLGGWDAATKKLTDTWNFLVGIFNTAVKPSLDLLWSSIKDNLLPALSQLWTAISPVLIPVLKIVASLMGGVVVAAIVFLINTINIGVNAFSTLINIIRIVLNVLSSINSVVSQAMSGVYNALVSPFRDAFNWIKHAVEETVNKLRDLSPFTRHSPSLVDQVNAGTDIIKRKFASLSDLSFPSVADMGRVGFSDPMQSTFESKNIDSAPPLGATNNQNINVYIDKVNDQQDVDMISRRIAFKLAVA